MQSVAVIGNYSPVNEYPSRQLNYMNFVPPATWSFPKILAPCITEFDTPDIEAVMTQCSVQREGGRVFAQHRLVSKMLKNEEDSCIINAECQEFPGQAPQMNLSRLSFAFFDPFFFGMKL